MCCLWRKKSKKYKCPVKGCAKHVRTARFHVIKQHMPALLWMFLGQFNLGMEIIHNQTKVIKQQGWVICQLRSTKKVRLGDLVVKHNKVTIFREDEQFLKAMCVSMGWLIPE